jgi:putative flippase GtrA
VAGVTVVRSLYNRFEHLVHELSKFGAVGAIALAVNMCVFNVYIAMAPSKQIFATIVSTVVATCVAYVGNRYWTYKDRDKMERHREMLFFFLINGVAAVIEVMFVFISKYGLGQNGALAMNAAKYVFGLPLGMLFRLYCYRTFVFPEAEVVPAAATAPLYPNGHVAQTAHASHTAHQHQRPVPETAGR